MKKHYIGIDRFRSLNGEDTYFVVNVETNKVSVVYRSGSKNGAHQVAHRIARTNSLPLYETIYSELPDENGVAVLKPTELKQITL